MVKRKLRSLRELVQCRSCSEVAQSSKASELFTRYENLLNQLLHVSENGPLPIAEKFVYIYNYSEFFGSG